jgi:hypothetical protein
LLALLFTIIPLRECHLKIKAQRAASFCHLTQSLKPLRISLHFWYGVKMCVFLPF